MQKAPARSGLEQKLGKIVSSVALGGALVFSEGCVTPTPKRYYAEFKPKTIPHHEGIRWINVTDIVKRTKNKIIDFDSPPVEIRELGYKKVIYDPAPVKLNFAANREEIGNIIRGNWNFMSKELSKFRVRTFQNDEAIRLEKNPDYRGPIGDYANKVVVQINSEPRGARVYEEGKLLGTI